MKICPICKQTYEDHFRFCTNDGASLGERPVPVALASPDPMGKAPDAVPETSRGLKLAAVEDGLILPEPSQQLSVAGPTGAPPVRAPSAAAPTAAEPMAVAQAHVAPTLPVPGLRVAQPVAGGGDGGGSPQGPPSVDGGTPSVPQTEAEYQADLESISTLRAQFESSTALPMIEPTDADLRYLIKASRPAWIPWAFVGGALVALAVAGWLFFAGGDDSTSAASGVDRAGEADRSKAGTPAEDPAVEDAVSAQDEPNPVPAADAAVPQRPDAGPDLSVDAAPPAPPPTQAAVPTTAADPTATSGALDKPAVEAKPKTKPRRKRTRSSKRKARAKKRRTRRKTTRKRSRRARRETTIDPFAE